MGQTDDVGMRCHTSLNLAEVFERSGKDDEAPRSLEMHSHSRSVARTASSPNGFEAALSDNDDITAEKCNTTASCIDSTFRAHVTPGAGTTPATTGPIRTRAWP